jgi:hypothetical protein
MLPPPKTCECDSWAPNHSCHASQHEQDHDTPYYKHAEQEDDYDSGALVDFNSEDEAPHRSTQKIETKTVRFKNCPHKNEDRELEDLVGQLHGLDIQDSAYVAGYAHLAHHFPNAARDMPKPEYWQATMATTTFLHQVMPPPPTPMYSYQTVTAPPLPPTPYTYQATLPPLPLMPAQTWATHTPAPAPAAPLLTSNGAASFFCMRPCSKGCSFCLQLDHHIQMCPLAIEYVHMGHAKIIDDKMHLPNE